VLNGRYRLLEVIGEGGMATVYRALDTRLGRTVAIKVLHPQFARDEPFLQRFQQEAEFAASLGAHPNIVAIYDIGEDGPTRFIVMELVEGPTLKELIRERAPFPVGEAFSIGQQVASALDFAHKRGLVHRDVKPQNIMVTPEGVAKVTDFGIARSLSASQLTRTGMVIGTAHYFSPEQAQGKGVTPASDIYSLGIILYEMLTGHLPFDADNAVGVAMQHLHSEPPSPWDYNPSLPTRPVATVLRALEKDPERRYRDAAELAAALASASPTELTAGTTMVTPIVSQPTRERTAVYEAVRPVSTEVAPRRVIASPPPPARRWLPFGSTKWQPVWLALAALLVVLLAAAATYAVAGHVGGTAATATPTRTPTATPVKKRKPTATASIPVVVATSAPTVTNTAVPPTSTPPPQPTATPPPQPTVTPTPVPATPTPTAGVQIVGPTPTNTPYG